MSDSFIINDLTKLAISIRKNAALSFSEDYTENLDNFISIGQMEALIVSHAINNGDGSLILDEQGYEDIFDETRIWIYNIGLAKLAAEDKVECAWDDESNEMIFWTKDSKAKRKSTKNHKKKGMTLIELTVVLVILSLLCVTVLPMLYVNRDKTLLRTEANKVSGHLNHAVSKAIGNNMGYGVLLDNDINPNKNLINVLNFCSGMTNISGSSQLTTTSGTDDRAYLNPPIPIAILGKIYTEFPSGTLISFVGHPYEYMLDSTGGFCLFRSDANQNCYNSAFPYNSFEIDNPYYTWRLLLPPKHPKGSKSLTANNLCIDLNFSTIGIYDYGSSDIDIPEYPLTITFDSTGEGYTAIYNTKGITKQKKITELTPIALLIGFIDQVGENWIMKPDEDNPGWNIQRRDTYWVVFEPKSCKTTVIQNYVKQYSSEPSVDIAIKDSQTFVRQQLKNSL